MDERDIVEQAGVWLAGHGSRGAPDRFAPEHETIIRELRHDLTRARETQGELLAKSNEDDLVIDCYKKAESRWADSEAAYEQLISTTQAELAEARVDLAEEEKCSEKWMDRALYEVGGAPRYWDERAKTAEAKLVALRARVVEVGEFANVIESGNTPGPGRIVVASRDLRALSNLVKEVESGT